MGQIKFVYSLSYYTLCNLGKKKLFYINYQYKGQPKCQLYFCTLGQTREVHLLNSSLHFLGKWLLFSTYCYFSKKKKNTWFLDLCHLSQRSLIHDMRWHSELWKPSSFSHYIYTVNGQVGLFLQHIPQVKSQGNYLFFSLLIQYHHYPGWEYIYHSTSPISWEGYSRGSFSVSPW